MSMILNSRLGIDLQEILPKLSSDEDDFQVCSVEKNFSSYLSDSDCQGIRISTNLSSGPPTSVRSRKRRRIFSSSSEDSDQSSRNVSPEITYGGTPVAYKVCQVKGEYLVLKVPMSKRSNQKCSDRDIVHLLDSDSEPEAIFESLKKSGARVVGSLPREPRGSRLVDSPRSERSLRCSRSASKESSSKKIQYESSKEEEASLRIKLRRSTEGSNYKIHTVFDYEDKKCRSSPRSTARTPKKCPFGDCDEDHGTEEKRSRTTPKTSRKSHVSTGGKAETPSSRRNGKTLEKIKEYDGSENETHDEDDEVCGRRGTRRTMGETESPRKRARNLEEIATPRSARPRRTSRLVNYNYNALEGIVDKENQSDNEDSDCASPRGRAGKKSGKSMLQTPQKRSKILEQVSTPKRTPRKSIVENLEATTPKRTPRKSAVKKVEDPVTPSTNGRRISKIGTPSMKNGSLTPSMSRRTGNVGKPVTVLQEARAKLHVSAVPKSLPCREEEFNDIYKFLERKLLDNNGGCIYISGVPGTGKTATVNEVVRCLKKLVGKGDLDNFEFIEINGMKLSEPRQAYVQILKQINGQTATWEQAYQILEKRFTKSSAKRPMTLLLVDELDLLCNKRQDVVYNLLDWPAKANAQLVVITIANTMDLPERVLMGRVTSRLGLTRLTFQPYNHKQLQEIVMARLRDSDAFKSEAIQLVARKVAAVSGDARRALDICRRATEIAESNDGKIVSMQDVNQALTEMIASAKVRAIKHCSEMEKVFLQAVSAEVNRTGVEETSFYNVYRQLESLCSFEGSKIPNVTQALGICARLGANRLLLCEHSRTDTQQRILLNVSSDDIHFAMQTISIA